MLRLLCALLWLILIGANAVSAAAPISTNEISSTSAATDEINHISSAREKIDLDYYRSYHQTVVKLNAMTIRNLEWQGRAQEVMLWVVVLVVLAGLGMSALQLWVGLFRGGSLTDTTLDVSASNIRVTSSIVGVIILAISLAFLYLFLREVYAMRVVDFTAPASEGQPSTTLNGADLAPADVPIGPNEPLPQSRRR